MEQLKGIMDRIETQSLETLPQPENMPALTISSPQRYILATLEDFTDIGILPIMNWIKNPSDFVFISGGAGTGKTRLIWAIARRLAEKGIKSGVKTASDLFLELRKSFDKDSEETEWSIIRKYRKNMIGFFDDVGVQGCKEYVLEAWYNIINHRYENCTPTLFTSNYPISELAKLMGDRIASRLASGIIMELGGLDRRLEK